MTGQKFELSDISGQRYSSETNLTMGADRKGGCFISSTVIVVLVFLGVALAVAVGLIVFFAVDGRDIVCQCGSKTAADDATASAIKDQCVEMANQNDPEVCGKCEESKPTTVPVPTSTSSSNPTPPTKVKDVRLPTSVKPLHYDVWLQPYMDYKYSDPKQFTFKGKVTMEVECMTATDNITIHINVLQVNESTIRFMGLQPTAQDPAYSHWQTDTDRQFFIIKLTKNMEVGRKYAVSMDFTSPLKDDLTGLYYSSYTRGTKKVYLATTQLQPTDARKTFPCMDEPAIKATFNVTLVRPTHLISISNTPIIDNSTQWTEDGVDYVADVFAKTPKMSTYLLAFIICDFDYTEGTTQNNVQYRALARPEAKESTRYALQVGLEVLTYYEEYFDIRFPLPKQDMIAIPDFSAGAMENWGLITYRETAMLFQPGVSNERNKERVAIVVSHELAHQWFGDLVTLAWWDDLWLNEGFASFVEYLGVDHIHPEWRMFELFAVDEIHDVLEFDGLVSSHPIYVPVYHPDEINEIFDRISYGKGACIIRMIRHFLGYETFRKGLVRYLDSRKYGSAVHDDLWQSLSEQAKIDGVDINVKDVMDTWTLQMNYPVVLVTRDFHNLGSLHVSQNRYVMDRKAKDPGVYKSPFGYKWNIPLTFTSSKNPNFNETLAPIHWMYKNETQKYFDIGEFNLPPQNDGDGWILANIQHNGYYRVNYQQGNWEALAKQLKADHTVIPVINRAQIINDAWNLAKSDDVELETALMVIEYLKNETEYVPWAAANREMSHVIRMLSLTPSFGPFLKFLAATSDKAYTKFGLNNTGATHVETYARVLLATLSCTAGNADCVRETSRQYKMWMDNENTNPIDVNLKSLVYCIAVEYGGWDEWNFALRMYLNASVASEKANLLYAMSCSKKPWILNNYLYMILEENSVIRKQDALTVISYVARNIVGRPLAWNFFRFHYDLLKSDFGNSIFAWARIISSLGNTFTTQFDMQELTDFMQMKADNLGSGKRAFDQAVEKTQSNVNWLDKNLPIIEKWLADGGYN